MDLQWNNTSLSADDDGHITRVKACWGLGTNFKRRNKIRWGDQRFSKGKREDNTNIKGRDRGKVLAAYGDYFPAHDNQPT